MGIAASQARYLALTARKTNTEWEGQQINQARLALANQSADLFNNLLALEVPQPPDKTNYTELKYSYTDGANESVLDKWEHIGTENPDYNYIVKHYHMADVYTGTKKTLQDPQVRMGNILKELDYDPSTTTISQNGADITVTYREEGQTKAQNYEKITNSKIEKDSKLKEDLASFEKAKNMAKSDGTLSTDAVYGYQDADGTWHFFVANDYSKINQSDVESSTILKNALTQYEIDNGIATRDADGNVVLKYDGVYGFQDGNGKWNFMYDTSKTEDNVIVANDYKDYTTVSKPSYVGNSQLTELDQLTTDESLDINQVAELAQILRDFPDDKIKDYISFDEDGNLVYKGYGIYTFDLFGSTYYTTEADLQQSAKSVTTQNGNKIDNQSKLNYYFSSYVSKKIEETNKALLETDGSGRFKSVKFDNDTTVYNLNVGEVMDESAYQDAYQKYLYKKTQYEKTIADINAKTSIIHQEDRTLELRLKQLETEQTALKTEMEAIQKVVKENVEKIFKTFND